MITWWNIHWAPHDEIAFIFSLFFSPTYSISLQLLFCLWKMCFCLKISSCHSCRKHLNYKGFGANAFITTHTNKRTHTNPYTEKHLVESTVITVIVSRLFYSVCLCDSWCLFCVFGGSAFIMCWPLLSHGPISFAMQVGGWKGRCPEILTDESSSKNVL